ncbi:hypothetical protein GGF46_004048 [Coemansia sp. RSA 552]|nr:hypothetical protein GGF46_004048 [Coemansia sp. RSA 552]
MLKLKQILTWCIRHKSAPPRRPRVLRRRGDTMESADIMWPPRFSTASRMSGGRRSADSETLVDDEKFYVRGLSDSHITETDHVYSYYPWPASEHEEILRRSPPPPSRRHYDTFPSLVEMGGFLSL